MATEACFVDSYVPMYAVGVEHALKQPCVELLRAVARGEISAVTSVEVLQELLHRYSAQGRREHAVEVVQSFMEIVPDVLPVTREDITAVLALHAAHPTLQTRDLIHLATMRQNDIHIIITADLHFDGIPGLRRVDPAGWTTLRPDVAVAKHDSDGGRIL
jgi:predicted nucleic acid-binding protein